MKFYYEILFRRVPPRREAIFQIFRSNYSRTLRVCAHGNCIHEMQIIPTTLDPCRKLRQVYGRHFFFIFFFIIFFFNDNPRKNSVEAKNFRRPGGVWATQIKSESRANRIRSAQRNAERTRGQRLFRDESFMNGQGKFLGRRKSLRALGTSFVYRVKEV